MSLLLDAFWPGLAGAAALGLAIGWFAGWPARAGVPLVVGGLAVLAAGAAASGLVPGVAGLWVEGLGVMLAPYAGACAVGALGRRLARG